MTHTLQSDDFRPRVGSGIASKLHSAGRRDSILRRVLNSISSWDQRQADEEIGRLLARTGGRLTDDVERRMIQSATTTDWCIPR
jgi:hypothetical protein